MSVTQGPDLQLKTEATSHVLCGVTSRPVSLAWREFNGARHEVRHRNRCAERARTSKEQGWPHPLLRSPLLCRNILSLRCFIPGWNKTEGNPQR